MQYKKDVFIDTYCKRPKGKIYRDVRFHVKGGTVEVNNLLCASNDAAYEMAKHKIKQAIEL